MQAKAWKECVINFRKQGSLVSRPSSGFNVDKTWLENALEEHARSPFRAIVDSTDDNDSPAVVPVGVRMLTSPLWQASGNDRLERKASSMVERIQPLLNIAKTIVLVDRHFYIDGRFTNVLAALLQYVAHSKKGPRVSQIKYVISDAVCRADEMEERCRNFLPNIIPAGHSVKFYVKQKNDLHDRFVLTEHGGVQFGQGLDEGEGEVILQRLERPVWAQEWQSWEDGSYKSFEITT